MNTVFNKYKPALPLRPYVEAYWEGYFNAEGQKLYSQTVLPNGCVELIIHKTEGHCALSKNSSGWARSPEFTLLGMYDRPYEVQFSQPVKVFGIRFYPDGIHNIFGVAPAGFMSTYEDSADVLGKKLNGFCRLAKTGLSAGEIVDLADQFLGRLLEANRRSWDYTHLAMELIRKMNGLNDYAAIADTVPISTRQLQREFKAVYGVTVRDYMRISRMNAIHHYMLAGQGNLTQLSHDLHFTDQSHFIREFKNFAGVAPKKLSMARDRFIINPLATPEG